MNARVFGPFLFALLVQGCGERVCVDRGAVTTYSGSYTYTTSQGVTGATPAQLVMDDFSPFEKGSCDPADAEFTVQVGTCSLRLNAQNAEHDTGKNASGDFISASASVEPSQTCTLSLAGKPVNVSVNAGSLSLVPGSATLDVTAYVVDPNAPPTALDTVSISFKGAGG